MAKKPFIKFDQNNSKVELTLTFSVVEGDSIFAKKTKLTRGTFTEILTEALNQRMEHCQNELTTEILPQKDKVFTPYGIFSNEVGKHFSIHAYEAMEALKESIQFQGASVQEIIHMMSPAELVQSVKAVSTMDRKNIEMDLIREVIDALMEGICLNSR